VITLKKPTPEKRLIKPGKGGIVPPIEHRWQPGQSGNPNGRPALIKSAYERALMKPIKDEDGKERPYIDLVAENLAATAASSHKNNVSAAQELRRVVEPTESEEGRSFADSAMARFITTIFHDRLKRADAIEV
jgi:hypothetical protein